MSSKEFVVTAQNVRMPRLIYGTAWKKDQTAALVEQALRSGFRGIDTACQPKHYHEAGVGEGIQSCANAGLLKREDLYLQTKFTSVDGHDPRQIPYDPAANLPEQVRQSFAVSLKNLKTDYLDGLVLHGPLATFGKTLEVWRAMEGLVEAGKVRQLGISNCYELSQLNALYTAAAIKPAVLQNRFYAQTGYDRQLREFCKAQGIIYQSFWTLTANPQLLSSRIVQAIAAEHARSPAQVFFRYLTQTGIVPLTGTTSVTHMQQDLAIFEFELSAAQLQEIAQLL